MAWPIAILLFLIPQGNAPAPAAAEKPATPAAAPADAAAKPAAGAPAKNAATAPAPAAGSESSYGMIMFIGPIFLLFWLLIIRPQKQQEAKHRQLLSALKKNDKVQTSGGILGTVVSADPANDKVVVRVDDDKGVKLTFTKASIVRVIDPQAEKAAEPASS